MASLIGIAGPARSGKDTAANFLFTEYGYLIRSFASPIRDMLKVLGIDPVDLRDNKDEVTTIYGKTPRYMMQKLGTDWGRDDINPDIWVIRMEQWLNTHRYSDVVIPDIRFENEADLIRSRGGIIIHITCRGGIEGNHKSEDGIKVNFQDDYVIDNGGTIDELHTKLEWAI